MRNHFHSAQLHFRRITPVRDVIWRTAQEEPTPNRTSNMLNQPIATSPRPTHYTLATKAGVLNVFLEREGISSISFQQTPWEKIHQEVSQADLENVRDFEEQSVTHKHLNWLRRIEVWPGNETTGLPDGTCLLPGTPFQKRVWATIRTIPCGETRSYEDIAKQVESGARAVAQACAANVFALWIPCHRVIPKKGGVGGYKWGAWRKAILLDLEQSQAM